MTREKYAALYETPYQLHEYLQGNWTGYIQYKEELIPVSLTLEEEAKIKIGAENWQLLQNGQYTQFQKLSGHFESHIPIYEKQDKEKVYTTLFLYHHGTRLEGYVAPHFEANNQFFSYSIPLSLIRD